MSPAIFAYLYLHVIHLRTLFLRSLYHYLFKNIAHQIWHKLYLCICVFGCQTLGNIVFEVLVPCGANKTVVAILRYCCNNVVHCSVGECRFFQKCDKGHNLSVCDLQKAWPFTFIWFWVYLWKNMLSFRNFALEGWGGLLFPKVNIRIVTKR